MFSEGAPGKRSPEDGRGGAGPLEVHETTPLVLDHLPAVCAHENRIYDDLSLEIPFTCKHRICAGWLKTLASRHFPGLPPRAIRRKHDHLLQAV